MTDAAQPSVQRFKDLASLRARHLQMLGRETTEESGSDEVSAEAVQEFLQRAKATGAILSEKDDRDAAQRVIDYWSADLVAAERSDGALGEKITLDPCTSDLSRAAPEGTAPSAEETYTKSQAQQYIRIASVARQWRDTRLDAYLLTGDALENASQFDRDPDIARLILASVAAERKTKARQSQIKNRFIVLMGVVCVLLTTVSLFAWWARERAVIEAKVANEERAFADSQLSVAEEARERATEEKAQADALAKEKADLAANLQLTIEQVTQLSESREEQRAAAQARLADLESRQRQLDEAIAALGDLVARGDAQLADIPMTIEEEVLASLAARIRGGEFPSIEDVPGLAEALSRQPADTPWPNFESANSGYQDEFLEVADTGSLLPVLSNEMRARAAGQGVPVPYLNYSLVLDAERRFAIFAAANLDRTQRIVLPSGYVALTRDPRLSEETQPDPSWYLFRGLMVGELVGRNDIAWGKAGGDAAVVDRMVAVYPNTAPVVAALIPGWTAVSNWVQSGHNPSASRVTILSGFVFAPEATLGAPPTAMWKVAISQREVPQIQAQQQMQQQLPDPSFNQSRLVVDAFLVDRAALRDDDAFVDPDQFRISVDRLERLTGLSFAPVIRAADFPAALTTLVGDWPPLVYGIVDPLSDTYGERLVVTSLLQNLQESVERAALGQSGPLVALSEVPEVNWDRPEWLDLKANARRTVVDLEARWKVGVVEIEPDSLTDLDNLKSRLDLGTADPRRVYLQFSGLTRERAGDLRSALADLGWNLEPEERTKGAIGSRQVRYNAQGGADAEAARLLAADIAVLGWEGVVAVPDETVQPGTLEIRIEIQ